MIENEQDNAYLEVGYSILISMIVLPCKFTYPVIKEYKADYANKFPCRIHF